ncbi:MAG: DMT family transporter [Bacteroidales bacterium]|jgi:drug/metabolite transporter (DMT)-like permease|nr:DMT family transporter [Bacteroidales bacterium]
MLKNKSAHIAILTANVVFGVNYVFSKMLVPEYMSPMATTVTRVVFAVLAFWTIAMIGNYQKVEKRDLLKLFICGQLGITLNMYLFIKGLTFTSPMDSSIIMTLTPLLVLIISAIVLKETITKNKIFGIILGATGAILLITSSGISSTFGPNQWLGNVISFGSSLAYSIYLVLAKPLMEKYNPLTVMRWIFTFAAMVLVPIGCADLFQTNWSAFDFKGIGLLTYMLIGATFITYLCIAYGLKKVRSTTVSIYNYSQPVIASFLAIMLGIDRLSPEILFCAGLVFSGVYLVVRGKK